MVVNRKVTGKTSSMPAGLAMAAAVSLGTTLILASVIAKLVSSEKLAEEHIGYGLWCCCSLLLLQVRRWQTAGSNGADCWYPVCQALPIWEYCYP